MPTLLSRAMYDELAQVHASLVNQFGSSKIAGIHLPWAGEKLRKSDGQFAIYMVGSAPANNYATGVPQNFDCSLENLEKEWRDDPKGRKDTPFWRFLSGLTDRFYGKPHYECLSRWGWSNLFKIAYNEGKEENWPPELFQRQRAACVRALSSEFRRLRNALIFVGSGSKYALEMIQRCLPNAEFDRKSYEKQGIYYWFDRNNSNHYVWGYHPSSALQQGIFNDMLATTIRLIEQNRPPPT
jgi:hypothetical protein